ncbi:MAG: hypothetical protein ACOYT4_00450 [Nanoarchaeota archaeon]
MENKIQQIEWEKLSPVELIGGIGKAYASYSKRDQNYFRAWKHGARNLLKNSVMSDWEDFHDFLDWEDYSNRSILGSWQPEDFEDHALWILLGLNSEIDKYVIGSDFRNKRIEEALEKTKVQLIEPGRIADKGKVKNLREAIDVLHNPRIAVYFPKIKFGDKKSSLYLKLDYCDVETCDGYEIDSYDILCSRVEGGRK